VPDAPATESEDRASAAGTHGPLLVVVLGLITAIGPLSLDMYLPAFPAIADDLGVPAAGVQLSLTSCLVGFALGQLICGPLSDRWGRRRPVVTGLLAYAVLSLLIALAPSAPVLIGLRLLQGFAGGAGAVVARAVVRDLYAGVAAAKFFSRLTLIFGVAPILAPILGSAVLRVTSWHGIFVVLGAIALALTVMVMTALPETLPPRRRSPGGLTDTARTARTLFADRIFLGYALGQGFSFAALFGYLSGSSFVLQDGYGVSPTLFSLLFGLNSIGLIVLSQANARLLTVRTAPPAHHDDGGADRDRRRARAGRAAVRADPGPLPLPLADVTPWVSGGWRRRTAPRAWRPPVPVRRR
jgi:DHA1 family bicyclomycin/chloramphenicol resistance-like MFS transporter